jgi:hypothetical protein
MLLSLILCSVYAWDMSSPGLRDRLGMLKGSDFLHFYTLGYLASHHQGTLLYDGAAQQQLARKLVPQAPPARFNPLYGPQVSLLLAPFGALSYGDAVVLWLLGNTLAYFACCYLVWRQCPHLKNYPTIVALAALAFPGLFHLLTFGQSSGLALVAFALAFLAYSARRFWLAGLAIGLLAVKPQLGLAAAILFFCSLEWKVIAGALLSMVAQMASAWAYFGWPVLPDYGQHLLDVPHVPRWLLEPKLYQLFSLRGFWSLLLPHSRWEFVLYLVSSAIVLTWAIKIWRRPLPWNVRFSGLLITTVLIAPHLLVYDLIILAPAFLLLADWLLSLPEVDRHPWPSAPFASLSVLLYLSYLLSLTESVTQYTHVQIETVVLALLLYALTTKADIRDVEMEALKATADQQLVK